MGMGGRIVNAAGEEFMSKVHPAGVRAPRFKLVQAVMKEIAKDVARSMWTAVTFLSAR